MSRRLVLSDPVSRHPINNGLAAWWLTLPGIAGGGQILDLVGSNHGTLTSGPTWSSPAGRPGGFGSLDFASSYTSHAAAAGMDGATAYTISTWMYRSSTSNVAGIGRNSATNNRVAFQWFSDGNCYFVLDSGSNFSYRVVALSGTGWHHLVMVYDGSQVLGADRNVVYIDGVVQSGTLLGTPPTSIPSVGTAWQLGRYDNSGNSTCRVDDCRLYSRTLSADQVLRLYNDSRLGYPLSLRWQSSRAHLMRPAAAGGTSGSLSSTLGALTLSGTGTLAVTGTAAVTLGTLTVSAAGTVALSGALSSTLGTFTVSAAGTLALSGTLASTLGAVTLSSAGLLAVSGTLASTLGALTVSAAGTVTDGASGNLSVTLGAATVAATGALAITGTLSVTLGALTLAGGSQQEITANLAVTLGSLTVSAAGLGLELVPPVILFVTDFPVTQTISTDFVGG